MHEWNVQLHRALVMYFHSRNVRKETAMQIPHSPKYEPNLRSTQDPTDQCS
jgi:hypothetical protein